MYFGNITTEWKLHSNASDKQNSYFQEVERKDYIGMIWLLFERNNNWNNKKSYSILKVY